jgi:hypothetical protein
VGSREQWLKGGWVVGSTQHQNSREKCHLLVGVQPGSCCRMPSQGLSWDGWSGRKWTSAGAPSNTGSQLCQAKTRPQCLVTPGTWPLLCSLLF